MADLIDSDTGQWSRPLVWHLFGPLQAAAIFQIHPGGATRRDELLWTPDQSGLFSVKTMYGELVKLKSLPITPVEAVLECGGQNGF